VPLTPTTGQAGPHLACAPTSRASAAQSSASLVQAFMPADCAGGGALTGRFGSCKSWLWLKSAHRIAGSRRSAGYDAVLFW
jgi:hypothetical protein